MIIPTPRLAADTFGIPVRATAAGSPWPTTDSSIMMRALRYVLSAEGLRWLDDARGRLSREPDALSALFAQAGRQLGEGPLPVAGGRIESLESIPAEFRIAVEDAGRVLLVLAAFGQVAKASAMWEDLYFHGVAAEQRGVLRSIDLTLARRPEVSAAATRILSAALRTNDGRLIAAALGQESAASLLDKETWDRAVVSCLRLEIPLACVARLDRADADTAAMVESFAAECVAAGQAVPSDAWLLATQGTHTGGGHPSLAAVGRT